MYVGSYRSAADSRIRHIAASLCAGQNVTPFTLRYVTYIYIHTYILMYYMYVGRACAAKADACARLATARENRGAKNRQKARGMYE